jgi:hypothetical protein
VKKITTRTVRRIGRLQDGQLTIGLDVGDRSSFYCVIASSDVWIPRPRSSCASKLKIPTIWYRITICLCSTDEKVQWASQHLKESCSWTRTHIPTTPQTLLNFCAE